MQAFGLHQFLAICENVAGEPNRPPPSRNRVNEYVKTRKRSIKDGKTALGAILVLFGANGQLGNAQKKVTPNQ